MASRGKWRLYPRSLAGQMITVTLLALLGAHIFAFLIFSDERRFVMRLTLHENVVNRTAALARVLADIPDDFHQGIVHSANGPRLRFTLSDNTLVAPHVPTRRERQLRRYLARELFGISDAVLVELSDRERGWYRWRPWHETHRGIYPRQKANETRDDDWDEDDEEEEFEETDEEFQEWREDRERWMERRQHYMRKVGLPQELTVSVRLANGRWLNAESHVTPPEPVWAATMISALGLTGLLLVIVVVVMMRRVTRPLRNLAEAAERLGRGEENIQLPVSGAEDVRRTTEAFNQMQERLQRFLRDRMQMLGAISHDLRTPITSLRLRAEFIADEELKAKIQATLDEMQRMTEEVLSFVRQEASNEELRRTDLRALTESLCDDYADEGKAVTFEGGDAAVLEVRPETLRRVIRNLLNNALAYGEKAVVRVVRDGDNLLIQMDDSGPGIPEDQIGRVFEPFMRLEKSRHRDTGGIGLGLAISRSLMRKMGGDVELANRPGGGLRASVILPAMTGGQ